MLKPEYIVNLIHGMHRSADNISIVMLQKAFQEKQTGIVRPLEIVQKDDQRMLDIGEYGDKTANDIKNFFEANDDCSDSAGCKPVIDTISGISAAMIRLSSPSFSCSAFFQRRISDSSMVRICLISSLNPCINGA